jgi:hypothetical protein
MFHFLSTSFTTNATFSSIYDLLSRYPRTDIDKYEPEPHKLNHENTMCVVSWDIDNKWAKYTITLHSNNYLTFNHTMGQSNVWVSVFNLLKSTFYNHTQTYIPLSQSQSPLSSPLRFKTQKIELPPFVPFEITLDQCYPTLYRSTHKPQLTPPTQLTHSTHPNEKVNIMSPDQLIFVVKYEKLEIDGEYHKQVREMVSSVYLETYTSGAILYTHFVKNQSGVCTEEIISIIKILLTDHFHPQCVQCAVDLSMFISPSQTNHTTDGIHTNHTTDGIHTNHTTDGIHANHTIDGIHTNHTNHTTDGIHANHTTDGIHTNHTTYIISLFNHIIKQQSVFFYDNTLLWKNPIRRVQERLQQLNKIIV